MKPTLAHKPNDYAYQDLLVKFADGVPLSCEQLNFLDWHQKTLSNLHMDPVLKYYLKHYHRKNADSHSFLLPQSRLNQADVERLKRRLQILLIGSKSHLELNLTPEKFLQFRALTYNELILYHGNQLLTGAPFIQGGIPQLIFFQWGNLFGVAKYVVLADEKALKSNVLIYFEDLQDRQLADCVYQYNHRMHDELQQQHQLAPALKPQQPYQPHPEPQAYSSFNTPTLTLNPNKYQQETE